MLSPDHRLGPRERPEPALRQGHPGVLHRPRSRGAQAQPDDSGVRDTQPPQASGVQLRNLVTPKAPSPIRPSSGTGWGSCRILGPSEPIRRGAVDAPGEPGPPMDNVHPMEGKRRCTATNRQGNRCGRAPIPGGTVCVMHGGKIPAVKRKAQLRLLELVDPAIVTMGRIMVDQSQPPHARLRAAENVLDRVGVTRKVDLDADTARELLVERLLSMSEQDNNGDTGGQDTPSPQD